MKTIYASLTCLVLVLAPVLPVHVQALETKQKAAQSNDVALTSAGLLKGKAVNGQGEPLAAAQVKVLRNNEVVATAITAQDGQFEVAGLTTGLYDVQAGQGKGSVRIWEHQVAPPTARQDILMVSGPVARGQMGLFADPMSTLTLGLAITGVTLGAIALSESGDTIIQQIVPATP